MYTSSAGVIRIRKNLLSLHARPDVFMIEPCPLPFFDFQLRSGQCIRAQGMTLSVVVCLKIGEDWEDTD